MPDSNEFEYISEKIKGQLGIQNNTAAEARARGLRQEHVLTKLRNEMQELAKTISDSNDDALTTKILEEKNQLIKKMLSGELQRRAASKPAPAAPKRPKFTVPKGATILILKAPLNFRNRPPWTLDGLDFEAIITSKTVVYGPEDICMNPTTNECTLDSLRYSPYFSGEDYFAFTLPPNDKKIPFILVPSPDVVIENSGISSNKVGEIKQFLDEVFDQID